MNRTLITATLLMLISLLAVAAYAQDSDDPVAMPGNGNGVCQFIDEDGDGFNDLAPDDDGDGIPNGLDPDYVRPEDGTGNQFKWGLTIDLFGEGVGNMFGENLGEAAQNGYIYGPGDGTGSIGPNDGTGFGPGTSAGEGPGEDGGDGRRGGTQ